MTEAKSELTSARMFDRVSDSGLADWLDVDAQAMDGQPGRKNHVAATRPAAERLRKTGVVTEAMVEAAYRAMYGHYWYTGPARAVPQPATATQASCAERVRCSTNRTRPLGSSTTTVPSFSDGVTIDGRSKVCPAAPNVTL